MKSPLNVFKHLSGSSNKNNEEPPMDNQQKQQQSYSQTSQAPLPGPGSLIEVDKGACESPYPVSRCRTLENVAIISAP